MIQSQDFAKLLLRTSVGGLMLFHGIHKIIYGIASIKGMVAAHGLPEFFAYGVYLGEIVMPIFIILGLYAKVAALILAFTMTVAIYLAYGSGFLTLSAHGGPVCELALLYLVASLVIFLMGSGRYGVNQK